MGPGKVWGSSVFVASDLAFEAAVKKLDVPFGEGVGMRWFVVACAPEGGWLVTLKWW